jgi:hypothetical protein
VTSAVQPIAPSGGGLAESLLPPELPWLYVVIPLPAAYLMGHDLLGQPWPLFLRALLKMYLPFMVYGSAFHLVYRYLMPPLLRGAQARFGRLGRAALQLAPLAIVTPLVAVPLLPLMRQVLLFNSLNTVASLISEDPVLAERTLERPHGVAAHELGAMHP